MAQNHEPWRIACSDTMGRPRTLDIIAVRGLVIVKAPPGESAYLKLPRVEAARMALLDALVTASRLS